MADTAGDLARLKSLLLQPESRQLEVLQQQVRALDSRVGTRAGLEASTAEVLVAAFRRAETHEHRDLARAVAPVVVAAIQSEIRNSRDMMVEALYPITGRLVAAAVADAFRNLVESINARVDALMSARLWRLRLRSWFTRKPLSELLLAEATRAQLRRILFLERGSGVLVADWTRDGAGSDNADLVGGMIAAITEFSRNAFEHEAGDLRTIDMGASQLLLHASARTIVAGEIAGPLHPHDETAIQQRLAKLAALHNDERPVAAGDLAEAADDILRATEPAPETKNGGLGIWLVAGLLIALAAWFGWRTWTRSVFEAGIREAYASTVVARPALQAWPFSWRVDHGRKQIWLGGLAPAADDAQALRAAITQKAGDYAVTGEMAIVASQQSTQAAIAELGRQNESLQAALGSLRGDIARLQQSVEAQQPQLTGLETRAGQAQAQADELSKQLRALQQETAGPRPALERFLHRNALFFERDAVLRDPALAGKTMDELARLLLAANAGVRVVSYSSDTGSAVTNLKAGQERAKLVAQMLSERGVPAGRIVTAIRAAMLPIDNAPDAAGHANRRVEFEPLFDNERALP